MWSRLWHNYSYTFPPLRFLGHCVPRLLLGMNHRRNVLALTRNKHHRIPPSYYTSPHRVMQVYSEPCFFTQLKRPLGKREKACRIGFFVNDGEENQKLTPILLIRQYKMYLNKNRSGNGYFPSCCSGHSPVFVIVSQHHCLAVALVIKCMC